MRQVVVNLVSKEIVRFMGGSIKVESEFGRGARFVVVFPVAEAEQAEGWARHYSGLPV